jgi:hypothetical protein
MLMPAVAAAASPAPAPGIRLWSQLVFGPPCYPCFSMLCGELDIGTKTLALTGETQVQFLVMSLSLSFFQTWKLLSKAMEYLP